MNISLRYHKSYRKALRKLSTKDIGKVQEAVMDFEDNPKSPGLNLEPLHASHFYSIRASQDLRIILTPLDEGKQRFWILLYVDHHDKAYDWAQNRRMSFNDATQTYDLLQVGGDEILKAKTAPSANNVFASWSNRNLQKLGLPLPMKPFLLGIDSDQQLDELKEFIPEITLEALKFAWMGESVDEVIRYVASAKSTEQDSDLATVLTSPANQRNLVEVRRTDELEKFYQGDFADWMVYLHHTQRQMAEGRFKGPVKLTGGAGTGKTVVALHRAKYLMENARDERPIFFTTYNKNLAENLEQQFTLLGLEKRRVYLENIHAWIMRFAREEGIIRSPTRIIEFDKIDSAKYWRRLLEIFPETTFKEDFLAEEFRDVVLHQNVETLSDYLEIKRIGRGEALQKAEREQVWNLMEHYQGMIDAENLVHLDQISNDVATYLRGWDPCPFSHVIIDEIQDFGMPELRVIRQLTEMGENDLFLCGDPMQNIYGKRLSFSQAGIQVRGMRSQTLKINYRTTDEIRKVATHTLTGCTFDDFEGNHLEGGRSPYYSFFRGPEPVYHLFSKKQDEFAYIIDQVQAYPERGVDLPDICIAAIQNKSIKEILKKIHARGMPYYDLRSQEGDRHGVRISNFHKVKGLEFRIMILVGLSASALPYRYQGFNLLSDANQDKAIQQQKALLYVAMSRARDVLVLTGSGASSDWVGVKN